jgi:hypothetical protein
MPSRQACRAELPACRVLRLAAPHWHPSSARAGIVGFLRDVRAIRRSGNAATKSAVSKPVFPSSVPPRGMCWSTRSTAERFRRHPMFGSSARPPVLPLRILLAASPSEVASMASWPLIVPDRFDRLARTGEPREQTIARRHRNRPERRGHQPPRRRAHAVNQRRMDGCTAHHETGNPSRASPAIQRSGCPPRPTDQLWTFAKGGAPTPRAATRSLASDTVSPPSLALDLQNVVGETLCRRQS